MGKIKKLILIVLLILYGFGMQENNEEMKNIEIEILPLGSIEIPVLNYLKENLAQTFHGKVLIASHQPVPEYALNKTRAQYFSSEILAHLAQIKKTKERKILALIDQDLYVPELNFVFGEADMESGVCIVSLTRLRQSFWNLPEKKNLFLERTLKEAVHEIGHVLGLHHCPDPRCVMHFSNSILDTDRKGWQFCPQCKKRLR